MEILKKRHRLHKYYDETWNSYLNVCLLKIVVLLFNLENHLQTIFLPKNIAYLLSYFLSQIFLCTLFNYHLFPLLNKVFPIFKTKDQLYYYGD